LSYSEIMRLVYTVVLKRKEVKHGKENRIREEGKKPFRDRKEVI